jgi:hypothetical protein
MQVIGTESFLRQGQKEPLLKILLLRPRELSYFLPFSKLASQLLAESCELSLILPKDFFLFCLYQS